MTNRTMDDARSQRYGARLQAMSEISLMKLFTAQPKMPLLRALLRALCSTVILCMFAACGGNVRPSEKSGEPEANAEYRIGAGDALNVFVFNHPDLSRDVPVRPDGLISTPLVENMVAAGKTPSALARDMEKALADYVRSPKVNIIVTTFVGAFADQVRVVGQAARPQALPYRAGMSVLDVVIAVGGLAEFAAGNRAKLVRRVDGKEVTYKVKLDDLLHKGDIKANMPVKPGDVIIIPESRF